ncbi:MAG: hypothetical protein JSV43_04690 [Methanobacteriota archaeon]|nr:MAG: hypothetical protein JSV43_04690 [Euryarchaeota archaeon]
MEEISVKRAKEIAEEKRLHPGIIKGTEVVQFTKGGNPRVNIISWDRFEDLLKKRKLKIMESNGYMKIFAK